jgi:hypothetical protein
LLSAEMEDLKDVEKSLQDPILPWDRFSAWLHSVCVVTFDLELGQVSGLCKTPSRCKAQDPVL